MTDTVDKYDIIIIGNLDDPNYTSSKTYYLKEVLNKYLPDKKIDIYDICANDSNRIKLNSYNFIFLPWVQSIDINWCNFMINLEGIGKKILYTDLYYFYNDKQTKLLQLGFNLENLFHIIAFASREYTGWWNDRAYRYWGPCFFNDKFKNMVPEKTEEKYIFIDTIWDFDISLEPYNAKRIINECIPKIKENHPEIKIISQNNSENWVDINLEKSLPLDEMIKTYNKCVAYVVTHNECSGLAQFESLLCGTKIVSTRTFSNHAALLSGNYTHELWEFEKGNEDFIRAIESCIKDYDKNEVKELSLKAYNDKLFFDQMKNDLFLP